MNNKSIAFILALAFFAICALPAICGSSGVSGGGGTANKLVSTVNNSITLGSDATALSVAGAGVSQASDIVSITNLAFGGSVTINSIGSISNTYDCNVGRDLNAGGQCVFGNVGGGSPTYTDGGVILRTAGKTVAFTNVGDGVHLKAGSNALVGTGTLSGGAATVTNTAIDADDIVQVFDTSGTPAAIGENLSARVAATSFAVAGNTTHTFSYQIVKVD